MTVVSILPDSTISNTGSVTGAGGDADAALADSDDTTYVFLDAGELVSVGFANPSLPAGSVAKQVAVLIRVQNINSLTAQGILGLDTLYIREFSLPFSSDNGVTTLYGAIANGAQVQPNLNSCAFTLQCKTAQAPLAGLSVTSVAALVTYVEKPVVNVLTPTSTITEDNRPTITWQNTLDGDGGGQFSAVVKIFTSAVYGGGGFDPDTSQAVLSTGFFGGQTSYRPDEPLPNGTYRAYVLVSQLFNSDDVILSDWAYEGFVLDVDSPAAPDLVTTGEYENARVRIELASNTGDATTSGFEVWSDRGIDEWELIRTVEGDGTTTDDPATLYDYESPNGDVKYRARAFHSYSASTSWSDWVYDSAAPRSQWWLKHPHEPRLNVPVILRSFTGHSRESRRATIQPIGATNAVGVADSRGVRTGQLVIAAPDDYTVERVQELASAQTAVLITAEYGHHEPDRWVVLGNETVERLVDNAYINERNITYEWTEVDRPAGDLVVVNNLYDYPDLILLDRPALYWRFDSEAFDATTIVDSSGFGHHGQAYDEQAVSNDGTQLGFWAPLVRDDVGGANSALILGGWDDPPTTQDHPGAGFRADDYKPYVPGSSRTFECWMNKNEDASFATVFSSDNAAKPATTKGAGADLVLPFTINGAGIITVASTTGFPDTAVGANHLYVAGANGAFSYESKDATHFYGVTYHGTTTGTITGTPAVTWGIGTPHPTWEMGVDGMMRYYANTNHFPISFVDWGTALTGHPVSTFELNVTTHIVCTYDDTSGMAEWFVNGESMGQQGPYGYLGPALAYDRLSAQGNFQVGWRGGAPQFPDPGNTEVFGGLIDEIAVYEYLLTPGQIRRHYDTGKT